MKRNLVFTIAGMLALSLCVSASGDDKAKNHKKKETQEELQKQTKITMDTAKTAALAKENGTIKEAELEKEKGKLVYSFDIDVKGVTHEVQVDALSGAVIGDEIESP